MFNPLFVVNNTHLLFSSFSRLPHKYHEIMKQEIYDVVLELLSRKSSFYEGLAELKKTLPNIVRTYGEKTLRSIQAQYYVRRMKRQHHHHYGRETRKKYYKLYNEAKSRSEKHVIVKLATKNDISSCLLARIILEEYYWNDVHYIGREKVEGRHSLPPGFMTDCIRDIAKLPNPELASEIYETIILDNFYGPAVDSIKKTCGAEYEIILRSHCLKAGLSFKDEDQMREEGYDKTPDMKLKVPIMVRGRVVNWIESKASFGDPITHQQYTTDQFLPYKNRFGPGLVIYWFGFIDELTESTERGIILLDHFPDQGEITSLEDVLKLQTSSSELNEIVQLSPIMMKKMNNENLLASYNNQCNSEKETPAVEELISMVSSSGLEDKDNLFFNYVDPMFDSDEELHV